MADQDQVELIQSGVEAWNRWRQESPETRIDLKRASFGPGTDLRGVNLKSAELSEAVLSGTDLTGAELVRADLTGAALDDAILRGAHLGGADLDWADLSRAVLEAADLVDAKLFKTSLNGTNLDGALFGRTFLARTDLSNARGLERIDHVGPSTIGTDTLLQSGGRIVEDFLRGCGLENWEIAASRLYRPELTGHQIGELQVEIARLRSDTARQFHSCFISYSSPDEALARRLHGCLQEAGVRCWFAPEDMRTGDPIRATIDDSIRRHDKLLLILSAASLGSQWVEQEVETALERERECREIVLFPVRVDDTVMEMETGWPKLIRNTRHIGDFRGWNSGSTWGEAFQRLVRDLHVAENPIKEPAIDDAPATQRRPKD